MTVVGLACSEAVPSFASRKDGVSLPLDSFLLFSFEGKQLGRTFYEIL